MGIRDVGESELVAAHSVRLLGRGGFLGHRGDRGSGREILHPLRHRGEQAHPGAHGEQPEEEEVVGTAQDPVEGGGGGIWTRVGVIPREALAWAMAAKRPASARETAACNWLNSSVASSIVIWRLRSRPTR